MSTMSNASCFRQLPSIHALPGPRTNTPKTAPSYQLLLAAADRVQPKYWSISGRADHSLPTAIRYRSPRDRLSERHSKHKNAARGRIRSVVRKIAVPVCRRHELGLVEADRFYRLKGLTWGRCKKRAATLNLM